MSLTNTYHVPTGTVLPFAGSTAPTGYMFCDGSSISRTSLTTKNLFSEIGVTYGIGDGTTTFNLPDLRSRIPVGVGTGTGLSAYTLASTGGNESTTDVPSHTHTMAVGINADSNIPTGRYVSLSDGINSYANAKNGSDTLASDAINNTGVASVDIRQPYLALNYIIKL